MKIVLNEDKDLVQDVKYNLHQIRTKYGKPYCPCSLVHNDDTICPCKQFRESENIGECHCGLFKKVL